MKDTCIAGVAGLLRTHLRSLGGVVASAHRDQGLRGHCVIQLAQVGRDGRLRVG